MNISGPITIGVILAVAGPSVWAEDCVEVPALPDDPPAVYGREIRLYRVEAAHAQALVDARRDISAGRLVRIEYGLRTTDAIEIAKRLESKWTIKTDSKGCVLAPEDVAYEQVYNALMEEAIFEKYGIRYETLIEEITRAVENERPNRVAGGN